MAREPDIWNRRALTRLAALGPLSRIAGEGDPARWGWVGEGFDGAIRLILTTTRTGPAHSYPGGGVNPPISAASSRANSIVVGSSPSAPMICNPTGSPAAVRPIGAAVAGR